MSRVHCEWGLAGVEARPDAAVVVVVDVLSFSTAVSVAVENGAIVLPFPLKDRQAAEKAAEAVGAVLARPRRAQGGQFSLSPATLRGIAPGTRLMLPSPNGSRISFAVSGCTVLAGCLRNAARVAEAALRLAEGGSILVVPAGERWPDGSLRPAIEDWLGAGAILHHMGQGGSPEARMAADAWRHADDIGALVRASISGRELIEGGFPQDVEIALEIGAGTACPVLADGGFRAL